MKRELDDVPPEETETSKKVCAAESEEEAAVAIGSVSVRTSAADGTMSADDRDADDASARGEADNAMSAAAAAATSSEEAASAAEAAAAASTVPSCASATPSFAAGHDGGTFAAAAAPEAPAPTLGGLSDEELAHQLQARADAKNRRDFTTSDSIRMQLEQRGIRIVDGRSAGGMGTWTSVDGRRYASHCRRLGISPSRRHARPTPTRTHPTLRLPFRQRQHRRPELLSRPLCAATVLSSKHASWRYYQQRGAGGSATCAR